MQSAVMEIERLYAENKRQSLRLDRIRDWATRGRQFGLYAEAVGHIFTELGEAHAVEGHRHNWIEREGDTQNLYCECGEVSRPLSPDVEGRGAMAMHVDKAWSERQAIKPENEEFAVEKHGR